MTSEELQQEIAPNQDPDNATAVVAATLSHGSGDSVNVRQDCEPRLTCIDRAANTCSTDDDNQSAPHTLLSQGSLSNNKSSEEIKVILPQDTLSEERASQESLSKDTCTVSKDLRSTETLPQEKLSSVTLDLSKERLPKENVTQGIPRQGADIEGVSSALSATHHETTTEKCILHPDRTVEYFCIYDSELCCKTCVDLDHRLCKLEFIPKASEKVSDGDEVASVIEGLSHLEKELSNAKEEILKRAKIVHECKDNAKKDIDKFRKELDEFLDNLQDKALTEAHAITDASIRKLEVLTEETETLTKMVEEKRKAIENVQSHDCNTGTYIEMKKTIKSSKLIENRLKRVNERTNVAKYIFKPAKVFEDLMKRTGALGQFSKTGDAVSVGASFIENLDFSKDFSVSEAFYSPSTFTGMELLPSEKLVITGWSGNTVFLFDIPSISINSRLELSAQPWGVISVTDTRVAITVPTEKLIQFAKITENTLVKDNEIRVDGECHGIACTGDKLVVTFPGQIQLIEMNGSRLNTITRGACGVQLSTETLCIAMDPEKRSFYVSDSKQSTVMRFSLDGQILAFYMGVNLVRPAGLAVDKHGFVYVCGRRSNNVLCLTSYLTEGWPILTEGPDDIVGPTRLAYCPLAHCLYLGRTYPIEKKIKAFKLHV